LSGGKESLVQAKKFSNQAFYPVSFYGIACFFSYGNSQPFSPLFIAAYYACKVLRTAPHPFIIYSSIIASVSDPFRFPVRLFFHAYRLYDHPYVFNAGDLYCQTFSALCSAAAQYLTTGFRSHPDEKAV
jgi:hypothetical protein